MKSGHHTLRWDSELPDWVGRHHEDPDTSDNYGAIRRAADEPLGGDDVRANDTNLQAWWSTRLSDWVVGGGHWPLPQDNGYTRVKRRLLRGTRAMTRRELRRDSWTWEQVRRCRRPNGERPRTYEELVTYGVLKGVVQIGETKSRRLGQVHVMRGLVEAARRHGHPAWFMVLDDMAPRDKVFATRTAGGQIALIFGRDGVEKPGNWATWPLYPNRIWGPDYAKRWLP